MSRSNASLVAVVATGHPDRDEWVDGQARDMPIDLGVTVGDDTYCGVWMPAGGRIPVHLFAERVDLLPILRAGWRYVRG